MPAPRLPVTRNRADAGHRGQVAVEEGQQVAVGDLVAVLEAMKMENRSPRTRTEP